MEVYIDDMLVKSVKTKDHLDNLKQTFDIFEKYKMQINLTKCSFGVSAGKFLRNLVTQKWIEAKLDQIISLINMSSPMSKNYVQRLNGRVVALSILR